MHKHALAGLLLLVALFLASLTLNVWQTPTDAPTPNATPSPPAPDVAQAPPATFPAPSPASSPTASILASTPTPSDSPSSVPASPTPTPAPTAAPPAALDALADHLASFDDPVAILQSLDLTQPEHRALAAARLAEIEDARSESVQARAARLGIPLRIDGPGHQVALLHAFRDDGQPLYRVTKNRNAAISSAANLLYDNPYSLNGAGLRVGVWDAGSVRRTHQEFVGRVTLRNASANFDDHATHVAGTLAAAGFQTNAQGMAPAAFIDSYDWNNDYAEMTAAGAASASDSSRLPLSNHSYGYNALTADMGRYEIEARTTDALAASLPYYLPFWAAGNEQDELTARGGFQSITFNGLAKNVLTVGAVNDAVSGGQRSLTAATMSYFSSWGPADDGRIKPDLVANGVTVYSPVDSSNTAYASYSGTSMASPSAAGSATLLLELYAREFSGQLPRASTLKALLIHTADDLGHPGPDYKFGWGLLNVQRAADVLLAHKASLASPKLIEASLTNAQKSNSFPFTWDGVSPLRATLVWTDPAGTAQTAPDSRTRNLVHNLDLTLTAPDGITVLRPYIMPFVGVWTQASMALPATTGKNNVDNVEQVYLASPSQNGTYTATVSLDGSLTTASQFYSLILTGGTDLPSNPPPSVALTSPNPDTVFLQGASVSLAASATDTTLEGNLGVVAQVEFFANQTSLGVVTTPPYQLAWTPPAPGTYSLLARATDDEGATAASPDVTVLVLAGDGTPSLASFSPASGAHGASITFTGQNFAEVTAVTFNGSPAVFTVNSLSQLTAPVPPAATTGLLQITTSRGTAPSASPFTVLQSPVLISQIYGGGGQTGATLNADFVELHNRSDSPVSLVGWSVQYASASGTTWQSAALSGSLAPGAYHLLRLTGGTHGAPLPPADSTGSINMSASSGKVALRNTTSAFTGSSPVGQPGLQDFVGYGLANTQEGSAPAPSPSTTSAIFRAGQGSVDTGDNRDDFTPGPPNPRNSTGGALAPVITSPSAAGGLVDNPFTYQITASNGPTSYDATPLPTGLTINPSTGLLSGTPASPGNHLVTLSATNAAGSSTASLTLTFTTSGVGPITTLLAEDFSTLTEGNHVSTNGAATVWSGNVHFPSVTQAYQAGGVVKLGSSNNPGSLTSLPLDLSANQGVFTVSFQVKGWTSVEGDIRVIVTNLPPQTVSYTSVMAGSFETKTLTFTGGHANATVRFETTAKRAYLDDILITTSAPASPSFTLTGDPTPLTATYGTPSASTFPVHLTGENLTDALLLTAPAGFELSSTSDPASSYAPTQSLDTPDGLVATTRHLRLAAGPAVGSYDGDLLASSPGALPRSLPLPSSEVRPKVLFVTALDRTKPFGTSLNLGTAAFTSTGLVGEDAIGAVTLTTPSGLAPHDPLGTTAITPAQARDGTFAPANYDIAYLPGTLTVTGRDFPAWLADRLTGPDAAPDADPDGDGLPNQLEFYLGLDPTQPDSPLALPQVSHHGTTLHFEYRRYKGQDTLQGRVEWTDDLTPPVQWHTEGLIDTHLRDEGEHEIRTATLTLAPDAARRFIRLRLLP